MGFGVWGLGFRVQGSGFRVLGLVWDLVALGFRGSRVVVSEFWSPVLRSMILDPGQFVDKVPIPVPGFRV